MTGADTTFGPSARRVAGACGWVIAAVGALVLLGWATDSTALKQVDAELPAMKALAALAIVALGIGIVLRAPERRSPVRERAGLGCAAFVAVIGIAVLFEHAFGGIGIDELLADDVGPDPGRPPLVAATTLTLCALALLTLDRDPPRYRASLWLTAVAALLTLAALVGFAYDVDYLRGRSGSSGVSLPGVLAAALAVTAIALSRPDRGAVAFFSGDDPASRFARRVAPVAIGVPIVLGVVRLAGEHAGLFGDDLGLAIVTLGSMAAVLAVIVLSARDLRHQAARGEVGEQSFRAVAEASLAAIVTADDRGRITYFNPAAERMFGYRAARGGRLGAEAADARALSRPACRRPGALSRDRRRAADRRHGRAGRPPPRREGVPGIALAGRLGRRRSRLLHRHDRRRRCPPRGRAGDPRAGGDRRGLGRRGDRLEPGRPRAQLEPGRRAASTATAPRRCSGARTTCSCRPARRASCRR